MRRFKTGGPISAAATILAPVGNNPPSIIVGSDALYAWQADNGRLLTGFPVRGRNFFASRPLVVDLYGDGNQVIIVGCDDNSLYGFDASGRSLPGFPFATGGDVYSSPAAADLDQDGVLEVVVGSDDGCIYAWKTDGRLLPGWPRQTGGFVSASPTIADLDRDGLPEIITGSWDCKVHIWRVDGSPLPGWPQGTGHFVWSTPQVVDLTGDGEYEVVAASDGVYAWRADGSLLPGWPQVTSSYVVGTPALVDLDGDGLPEIVVGADRLYAWRADGSPLRGFPVDMNTFFWSSPVIDNNNGNDRPSIIICGWDGCVYSIKLGSSGLGERKIKSQAADRLTNAPIFATPVLADLDGDDNQELLVGAWDGVLYLVKQNEKNMLENRGQSDIRIRPAETVASVPEAVATFVSFPGQATSRATMYYQANLATGSTSESWSIPEPNRHPVPLVVHRGRLTGLIQPFPPGTKVSFWAEINGERIPEEGVYRCEVKANWPGRIQRRLRKLTSRQPLK